MALLGESNQGLLAPRMGKAKGSYRFWEDTLQPYLQRVASGEIAEQGLKRYGDAVRAGLQGDYSQFGEVAGDAIMGPFNLAGGLLGTFGGKLAKTADLDMLKIAQEASERGMPESRVFDATGWFKGADGQWRFEIDDSAARFGNKHGNIDSIVARESLDPLATPVIGDAMVHKGLFSAYPDAPNIRLTTDKSIGGSYSPRTSVDPEIIRLGSRDKSTSLHELQHAIQQREGFARGGNPSQFVRPEQRPVSDKWIQWQALQDDPKFQRLNSLRDSVEHLAEQKQANKIWREQYQTRLDALDEEMDNAIKGMKRGDPKRKEIIDQFRKKQDAVFDDYKKNVSTPIGDEIQKIFNELGQPSLEKPSTFISPDEAYRRLAGETEARNVQSRMGLLGDDRRMLPPWMTEDVPRDKQIVRFDGGQNMAIDSLKMSDGSPISEDIRNSLLDTNRWFDRGLKIRKGQKLYRGVSGDNPYASNVEFGRGGEGRGLYTTTDKNQASGYGKVFEMPLDSLPKNPIRFRDRMAFDNWISNMRESLGFRRISEMEKANPGQFDEWIRSLDSSIDGVQIGEGSGSWFVRFPDE